MKTKKHKHEYTPIVLFTDIYSDGENPFIIHKCRCGDHQLEYGNKVN